MKRKQTIEERVSTFWSRVIIGLPDQCWLWTGARTGKGKHAYGNFWFNSNHINAHRFSYLMEHGSIPEGMDILHNCDVKLCVNPSHLHPGTHQQNITEAVERGRYNPRLGEENHKAVLTKESVLAIRERCAGQKVNINRLAKEFGVNWKTIRRVLDRTTWGHV